MSSIPQPVDFAFYRKVLAFLYAEARLLDKRAYARWLELICDDGIYWIPSRPGQTDPKGVPSIIYEDRPILAMRIDRLGHPRAYAALPPSRTVHLLGNVEFLDAEPAGAACRVGSSLLVVEYQGDRTRVYAGRCEHVLRLSGDTFRIALKRIDLLDCDGVHDHAMSFLL